MRTRNSKRVKQEKEYREMCNDMDKELQEEENFRCFFTNKQLPEGRRVSHHHLKKRTGSLLTDKQWIVPVYDLPHLLYHDLSVEKLEKFSWYAGFLKRLKEKDEGLYQKEIDKKDKS